MLFFPAPAPRHVLRDIAGLPGEDQLNCEILQAASGLIPHNSPPPTRPLWVCLSFFEAKSRPPSSTPTPIPSLSAFHSAEITQVPRLMTLSLPALSTLPPCSFYRWLLERQFKESCNALARTHAHTSGAEPSRIRTSADATSGRAGNAGSEVALQPLGVVAGLGQAAVLVQLPGANFAAAAAVQHHAHAGGALGHLQRTLAHGGAGRGGGVGGDGGDGGGEDLYSHTTESVVEGTSETGANLSAVHVWKGK